MKWKQSLKKTLKSVLVFAMVVALCGTTLAKAYASYATIVIEHVFVDNNNTYGKHENKQDSPAENQETAGEQADSGSEDSAPLEETGEAEGEETTDSAPRDALSEGLEVTVKGHGEHSHAAGYDCSQEYDLTVNMKGPEGEKTAEGVGATLEVDLDSVDSTQEVADILSSQLSDQLGGESTQELTEEQTGTIADIIAEELESIKSGDVDEENVWTGRAEGTDYVDSYGTTWYHSGLFLGSDELYQVELTDESKELLGNNGYETQMMKITLARSEWDENDKWVNRLYMSLDNGETWTDVNNPDAEPVSMEQLGVWGNFTYTFVHVREASYGETPDTPDPDPDKPDPDPDKPDPDPGKPDPDPVVPDPDPDPGKPDPDPVVPDPDPVIPDPDPVIPDPDPVTPPDEVEIADPETPLATLDEEEPVVEEEAVEEEPILEEILEPDVPLSDIPETGDVSVLWYGLAVALVAGLMVLLHQERRSKKTA